MDEQTNGHQQSTSILELMYLIRSKNRGELSFAEWREFALTWAQAVIAEYETREADTRAINKNERCG